MNLVADESVDRPVVERLRLDGHDVVWIAELSPSIMDDEVLREANDRNALLLTADMDFGELVHRQGRVHGGVGLMRLGGLPNATKAEIDAELFRDRAAELPGAFTVLSPGAVRIRPPAGP
jgi:predicted nuclease of predicted toxin-antitoxin system